MDFYFLLNSVIMLSEMRSFKRSRRGSVTAISNGELTLQRKKHHFESFTVKVLKIKVFQNSNPLARMVAGKFETQVEE